MELKLIYERTARRPCNRTIERELCQRGAVERACIISIKMLLRVLHIRYYAVGCFVRHAVQLLDGGFAEWPPRGKQTARGSHTCSTLCQHAHTTSHTCPYSRAVPTRFSRCREACCAFVCMSEIESKRRHTNSQQRARLTVSHSFIRTIFGTDTYTRCRYTHATQSAYGHCIIKCLLDMLLAVIIHCARQGRA